MFDVFELLDENGVVQILVRDEFLVDVFEHVGLVEHFEVLNNLVLSLLSDSLGHKPVRNLPNSLSHIPHPIHHLPVPSGLLSLAQLVPQSIVVLDGLFVLLFGLEHFPSDELVLCDGEQS